MDNSEAQTGTFARLLHEKPDTDYNKMDAAAVCVAYLSIPLNATVGQ